MVTEKHPDREWINKKEEIWKGKEDYRHWCNLETFLNAHNKANKNKLLFCSTKVSKKCNKF